MSPRYRAGAGKHKYGAVKTVVDNITFASKAEAKRYAELLLLAKAGKIECLELQPRFDLHVRRTLAPAQKIGTYVADFEYYDMTTGARVVEDVKGMKTPIYRWKVKHLKAEYGITIAEITR